MSIRELELAQQPLETQQLITQFKIIAQKLIDNTPGIVDAMIDIHKNLQQHEELVNLLDDEDIQMLHKAHERHKQVVLIQVNEKQISGRKKKLSENDLGNL